MDKDLDKLLEKGGFIRCQIEVTEFILSKETELCDRLKGLREQLRQEPSLLKRQELILQVAKWTGEADALRTLWHYISSLRWTAERDQ